MTAANDAIQELTKLIEKRCFDQESAIDDPESDRAPENYKS